MNCGRKAAKKISAFGSNGHQEALVEHPGGRALRGPSFLPGNLQDGSRRPPDADAEIDEVGRTDPLGDGEGLLRGGEQGPHAGERRRDEDEEPERPAEHGVDRRPKAVADPMRQRQQPVGSGCEREADGGHEIDQPEFKAHVSPIARFRGRPAAREAPPLNTMRGKTPSRKSPAASPASFRRLKPPPADPDDPQPTGARHSLSRSGEGRGEGRPVPDMALRDALQGRGGSCLSWKPPPSPLPLSQPGEGNSRVIPGGRSGEGDPWPELWVDSRSLRWLRHLRPGMTPAFMPSHSRHHRPRAGDPDGLRRGASPYRDGRHEAGHDSGRVTRRRMSGGNVMFSLCS